MKTLTISRNSKTVIVRFGRQIESIGLAGKSKVEIIDHVRWAAITMGAKLDGKVVERILEDLQ